MKRFKKTAPVWLQNLLFLLHPWSFEVALPQKLGEPGQHLHQGICYRFSKVMHSVLAYIAHTITCYFPRTYFIKDYFV